MPPRTSGNQRAFDGVSTPSRHTARPEAAVDGGSLAVGSVVSLSASGVGVIALAARHVYFRQADVKFHQFRQLKVGDRVRFLYEASADDRDRQFAIMVEPWPVPTSRTPPPEVRLPPRS